MYWSLYMIPPYQALVDKASTPLDILIPTCMEAELTSLVGGFSWLLERRRVRTVLIIIAKTLH